MTLRMTDEEIQRVATFYGITFEEGRERHDKVMDQADDPHRPICIGCARWPEEIPDYRHMVMGEQVGPDDDQATFEFIEPTAQACREYVIDQEGTYNPSNGHFLCDSCYIANGQPSSSRGWVCP